jgi:D-alanyl-D-alanine carboxypeptidase/D-alanyl-D-alanine-endopeptidase (penicillin-binding protein 4)
LAPWCLELTGVAADGSGLSRQNLRSAREWRRLLQVAAHQPWAAELRAALPLSGRTGTLAGRLAEPAVAGAVSAKTGTIIGGQALSGYAITASGRDAVFSIIANGEPGNAAGVRHAVDAVVTALVLHG